VHEIIQLLKRDQLRLEALECIQYSSIPKCYLAAGFVRNLVWDHCHGKITPTPLNDFDVIYYAPDEVDDEAYLKYEAELTQQMPQVEWQVRNQAKMHIRNADKPYKNIVDAMSYWPEKETAVAIRKTSPDNYECISAFGFKSLFDLQITYNPKRNRDIFKHRVKSKGWLIQWPKLRIAP
tara:strand:+ start:37098 stop:37634 length:537 start_codon:yes stop_codon:yes gene_type:complete